MDTECVLCDSVNYVLQRVALGNMCWQMSRQRSRIGIRWTQVYKEQMCSPFDNPEY